MTIDEWRKYFGAAKSDIFDIIDKVIVIASLDYPAELRSRRDRIAERLFLSSFPPCARGPRPCEADSVGINDNGGNELREESDTKFGGTKLSDQIRDGEARKLSCIHEDGDSEKRETDLSNQVRDSKYSFAEAEALTAEIEESSQIVDEVVRIKGILLNGEEESDSLLFDSLRRLQLMALTMDILKETEVGKSVNSLRKHGSKEIRDLARTLIQGWKQMANDWYNATQAVRDDEACADHVDPTDADEGLPSPPLDEGAFFATQTPMELSQFFDGIDDDDLVPHSAVFKNGESRRKPPIQKKQDDVLNPGTPMNTVPRPGRPAQKPNDGSKLSEKKKFKWSDEAAVQTKLEDAKRKLHERYQQAENAKKQRTVQVMELHDIPKNGFGEGKSQTRRGNIRHLTRGRG